MKDRLIYPISDLQSDAFDLFLVFISANDIRYIQPVDDIIYYAYQTTFPL